MLRVGVVPYNSSLFMAPGPGRVEGATGFWRWFVWDGLVEMWCSLFFEQVKSQGGGPWSEDRVSNVDFELILDNHTETHRDVER